MLRLLLLLRCRCWRRGAQTTNAASSATPHRAPTFGEWGGRGRGGGGAAAQASPRATRRRGRSAQQQPSTKCAESCCWDGRAPGSKASRAVGGLVAPVPRDEDGTTAIWRGVSPAPNPAAKLCRECRRRYWRWRRCCSCCSLRRAVKLESRCCSGGAGCRHGNRLDNLAGNPLGSPQDNPLANQPGSP